MEMPTPCTLCNETFELTEGRGGLSHQTSEITICRSCYDAQEVERDRIDIIRDLIDEMENLTSQIEECNEIIETTKSDLRGYIGDLEITKSQLESIGYVGEEDSYHTTIEDYY